MTLIAQMMILLAQLSALNDLGLRFNLGKTEYMETNSISDTIVYSGERLLKTDNFRYPNLKIHKEGDITEDVRSCRASFLVDYKI